MKGYKATYNYKCLDQHYEIGQTYELEGTLSMCVKGFHFCPNMSDVLKYYDYKPNEFKLLEIEALGAIVEKEDKACTNKIKIIREVPMEEWDFYKVLPNGHCEIHYKDFNGVECWREYDENGNVIHYKDSYGFECWMGYDEKGNEIYYKNSDGLEEWREYDENGNMIHYKASTGFEGWKEYDEKGNEIHHKTSNGYEWWKEYDENGNMIHHKASDGLEYWNEYDERGNVIHYKESNGYEYWKE